MESNVEVDETHLIFVHRLESTDRGFKGQFLRGLFPNILTPDFGGPLEDWTAQLASIIGEEGEWTVIGSSFGGLVSTITAMQYRERVNKLILMAPALSFYDLDNLEEKFDPLSIPVTLYHGSNDDVVDPEAVQAIAERLFTNLDYHRVEDDHQLHATTTAIDSRALISG
jgi:pimeloyl-ACP methyl ester carboxylesterase